MAKMLVCYYSKTQHTAHLAEAVAEGARRVAGVTVDVKAVHQAPVEELPDYDAIVVGSPTYYGTMAGPIKQWLDESVSLHGQLKGKVGGAFASSGNIAGGGETTILSILQGLLIHGMVVAGTPKGSHYGPVAIGKADERARTEARDYGKMLAELAVKLFG
ncbi:MAG: NAD(P)H-dependent oxidoreductase [Phycisphaerae bacterium]|jgi:NAD(P)H dehydrogenase (quinone)